MYQQLWGYKVEEKLYLGVCKQKRLNTTALENLLFISPHYDCNINLSLLIYVGVSVPYMLHFIHSKYPSFTVHLSLSTCLPLDASSLSFETSEIKNLFLVDEDPAHHITPKLEWQDLLSRNPIL
jgi:hypothetical protein